MVPQTWVLRGPPMPVRKQQKRWYASQSGDLGRSEEKDPNPKDAQNLPRIYVEGGSMASTTTTAALGTASVVPLTPAQSNYLHVMRIHSPKRWGGLAGHLRIFNGRDGEWLAKVVVGSQGSSEDAEGGRRNTKRPRRKGPNQDVVVVECLQMLREQFPSKETGTAAPGLPFMHLHG